MKVNGLDIVGITVNCGKRDMMMEACESIWKFYPEMEMYVVDSLAKDRFKHDRVKWMPFNYNIGHGPGICEASFFSRSDLFVVFDTDIIMDKGGFIERALSVVPERWYGVGSVRSDFGINQRVQAPFDVKYLDPYFCLINRYEFYRHRLPVNHGLPFISSCYDLCKKGLSDLLVGMDIDKYVTHKGEQTIKSLSGRLSYSNKERTVQVYGGNLWSESTF